MNASSENQEFLTDSMGRLVPRGLVKDIDLLRDELVRDIADAATKASNMLAWLKGKMLSDLRAFEQLSAEKYDVRVGGSKGNITLQSYDGRIRVTRSVQGHIAFDERLQVAKQLIDQCIARWTVGANTNVRALIEHAFQTDRQGKVSTERVLGLRKLDIEDAEWQQAMRAIVDSITVTSSTTYVRVHVRVGDTDQWQQVPLDLASVPPESVPNSSFALKREVELAKVGAL